MLKKIVLYSSKDAAGKNIAEALRKEVDESKIIKAEDILNLSEIDASLELCIVASKHKSVSEIPVLTTHATGNFGEASHGGNRRELSIAPAQYLCTALKALKKEKEDRKLVYDVCLEATHHGPTALRCPIMFTEVGSSLKQWNDSEACETVAEVIAHLLESEPEKLPTAIGFGGGHYCRKFSMVEDYALGHICPKHNLTEINYKTVEQMINKTLPKPEVALVEKKGLGGEKKRIMELLEKTGLDVIKI